MKKFILIPCVLSLAGCAAIPAGKGAMAILTVAGAGAAINIENSGDPVDTPKEALSRSADSVKEGYSKDHYDGHDLNN